MTLGMRDGDLVENKITGREEIKKVMGDFLRRDSL